MVFYFVSPGDFVVFFSSSFFWILTGLLVYLVSENLFGKPAALVALFLYSMQTKLIMLAIGGLAEPLCLSILLAMMLAFLAKKRLIGASVVAGLLFYSGLFVRQPMQYLVPITALGCFFLIRDKKAIRVAGFVSGIALMYLTLTLINPNLFSVRETFDAEIVKTPIQEIIYEPTSKTKTPKIDKLIRHLFGISHLTFSKEYPGHSLERSLIAQRARSLPALDQIYSRLGQNLRLLHSTLLFKLGSSVLALSFLLALMVSWRTREIQVVTLIILLMFAATICVTMLLFVMPRYFQIITPFMHIVIGYASVVFYNRYLIKYCKRLRIIAALTLLLAITHPWAFGHYIGKEMGGGSLYSKVFDHYTPKLTIGNMITSNTKKDDIIYSDIPWITAWYANRASIWTPINPQEAEYLARRIDIKYLFISLEDIQSFQTWRNWLLAHKGTDKTFPLQDWYLIDRIILPGNKIMYLFKRP